MKYLIITLSILILSGGGVLSEEKIDCSNLKKFSIQYTWCKSKNAGRTVKNKISNLKKDKDSNE